MKRRVISAAVALAIAVPLIIIGSYPFYVGLSILALLAYKELIDLKKAHNPIPDLVCCFGILCICILTLANFGGGSLRGGLSYQELSLCVLLLLVPTIFYETKKYTVRDAFYLIATVLFIGLSFNQIGVVRSISLGLFAYLLLIPVFSDTFAYIIGMKYGKTKMCPNISPHKSWEGSFAGLIAGTIMGTLVYSIWVSGFSFKILILSALLSCISQIGDLVLSKIKRENEIKDFSNIMPGHGGILDRLDSFIFVVLTYFLIAVYF